MFKISLKKKTETLSAWVFEVHVSVTEGHFVYLVTLEKKYYTEITLERISPLVLIEKSFMFLLERESPSKIFGEFNISQINDYFPEYESVLTRALP